MSEASFSHDRSRQAAPDPHTRIFRAMFCDLYLVLARGPVGAEQAVNQAVQAGKAAAHEHDQIDAAQVGKAQ